jgi:glycogen synthase
MEGYKQKKLSILMTTDTVGGVWTYCMELCKALHPFHVQFHLVTLGDHMQQWQIDEVSLLDNVKVYASTYKLEWMNDPWEDIEASGDWLLHLEKRIQPDIIHLNSFCYGALPFHAPKIVVAHSDVYSWWQAVRGTEVPDQWNEFYKRTKAGLDNADMIVAPSQAMMHTILQNYLTLTRKKIIYNARDISAPIKIEKQPVVFSAGRIWDEAKNIKLLVSASSLLNWPIKIAGDNEFGNTSTEIDGRNIEYLGKLSSSEVIKELSSASIYVLPAKYEPFGLSVLEAALCGCALVLGDIPSLKEIWDNDALYVNTNDAIALSETVNRLIADDDLREYYQRKSYQRSKRYTKELFVNNYFTMYKSLLPEYQVKQAMEDVAS